jgi:DNA-binding MarR family transcriptional regulator
MDTANLGYLLHHLSFVIDRQSDQLLQERFGIGFSQFKILMALKWHTSVQQRQIAEYLGQTEASISRQIKLMTEQGLLQSRISPQNRREHITTLTARGERIADEAMAALNEYHEPMFDRLSPKQQQAFRDILETMHREACQGTKPGAYHAEK